MARYPKAIWHPSPNEYSGRGGQKVMCVTNHIEQGTESSTDGWFLNAISQVSAHFGVARDGTVHQWVDTDDSAWVNGNLSSQNMSIGVVSYCTNNHINPNLVTVGIEHEGYSGQALTEAQYQATLSLQRWLLKTYPQLTPTPQHFLKHADWDSVTRANCPGPVYPWSRLMSDLSTSTNNPAPTPPLPPASGSLGPDPAHWDGIGEGAKALLIAHGDTPSAAESYEHNLQGQATMSRCYFTVKDGSTSGVIIWSADTGACHRYLVADWLI